MSEQPNELRKYRTETPNMYDDSELDPYQFRILNRVARRGICYETQRSLAESCKMSLGKVNAAVKWLLKNEWIQYAIDPKSGKTGLRCVDKWQENHVMYCSSCSLCEQIQQPEGHEQRSPGEQRSGIYEQRSPGERHLKKEPLKEPNTPLPPVGEIDASDPEWQEICDLVDIFTDETDIKPPRRDYKRGREKLRFEWIEPLQDIRAMSNGRSPELIRATVAEMRRDGLTIASPNSIVNIARRLNSKPNGRSFDGPLDNDVWRVVLDHARRGDAGFENPAVKAAVKAAGWPELQTMKPGSYQESQLKTKFLEAYHAKVSQRT